MSLVAGLSPINKVWKRASWPRTQLNNDENSCRDGTDFFFFGQCAKISLKFTDKEPIFADLSVIKTHFTDKPSFSCDLSVNFWPLWWGFTDKTGFLERLSVKPGQKRLNFYGQTAVFDHFVRNRHFWNSPFTDKASIFIDMSVNGSDFAKWSAAHHLLNHGQNVVFRYFVYFRGCMSRIWSRW